jgi:uncharacterized membrane protein
MMDLSLFWAKFLGIYLLIIGLMWLLRKEHFHRLLTDIFSSKGTIAVTGIINLLLGLAIVITHPIWHWNWQGLITLLGYLLVLSGILRLAFTAEAQTFARKFERYQNWIPMMILILIALYLIYSGFSLS